MSVSRTGTSYLSTPSARNLHETFVANVTRIMKERGLVTVKGGHQGQPNLVWLSEASGVPKRTVENLMGQYNQPTMVGAAAIARALGVPLDELLGMDKEWGFKDLPVNQRHTTRVLQCVHETRWMTNATFCKSCLDKWQNYQRRLNALYEANRKGRSAEWADEDKQVRADQTAGLTEEEQHVKR